MLKFLSILGASLLFVSCSQNKQAPTPPAPTIPVITITTEKTPTYEEFIGQIYGSKDVDIRARVEGFITEIHFREGTRVKEGDLLYTLEAETQNASVAAQQSKVAEAQTNLVKTKSDLDRIKPLAEMNAVSQSDLDKASADYAAAKAALRAAKANLNSSEVTQGYTSISAPNDGVIGQSKFRVGDVVGSSADNMILTEVSSIDSVRVEFFLPENLYLQLARNREARIKQARISPVKLNLFLSDGSQYPEQGRIDFIDRSIDPTTGAILVQSTFPNHDRVLRPGLFARVQVEVGVIDSAILVPQRSVSEIQGLFQVVVVTDSNIVKVVPVKMGQKIKNRWLVDSGLVAGDKIVFEGTSKVRDGMTINPFDTTFTVIPAAVTDSPEDSATQRYSDSIVSESMDPNSRHTTEGATKRKSRFSLLTTPLQPL